MGAVLSCHAGLHDRTAGGNLFALCPLPPRSYDLVAVAIDKSGKVNAMNGQRAPVLCHSDGGSFNDTN
jgi:hypothetical protein